MLDQIDERRYRAQTLSVASQRNPMGQSVEIWHCFRGLIFGPMLAGLGGE